MPSHRAYSEAQVIATGIELEKSGPVTAKLLHEALGGRGDRYTAFATWQAFTDHRQHLAGIPQKVEAAGYSPAVTEIVTQMLKLTAAIATQVQAETAEPLERRAGHLLHGLDELLSERSALRAENDDLRDALDRAIASERIVQSNAPPRPSLLILPDAPRRPPRERLRTSTHGIGEKG
jgi:regulator of replication initiation timing